MDKDNLYSINGGNKKDKEMEEALDYFEENVDEMIKALAIKATMQSQYYKSLKDAGFTDEQALEIVKNNEMI